MVLLLQQMFPFFFVVNSSQQFFHQFSMQLRCVRLNVWGLGSEMGCFNRRFSRYFQNHWKKEHGPVRKCSICVQARHFEIFFTVLSQRWPLNSLELHLELASVRCGFPMYMLHAQVFANALHLLVVWESFGLLATRSSAVWSIGAKNPERGLAWQRDAVELCSKFKGSEDIRFLMPGCFALHSTARWHTTWVPSEIYVSKSYNLWQLRVPTCLAQSGCILSLRCR